MYFGKKPSLTVVLFSFLGLLLVSCSGGGSGSADSAPAKAAAPAPAAEKTDFTKLFTQAELVAMGEKIYQTPGTQTCLQCHRAGGQGEGWAGAAVLRTPWKWRSFTGLGGYDALKADPAKFRSEMDTVLKYLIMHGGIKWNTEFAKNHPNVKMDWAKTGKKQYDMMMWGIAQAEMQTKVKKVQAELVAAGKEFPQAEMDDLATTAVYEYIKKFEKPNKGKDGKALPKVFN